MNQEYTLITVARKLTDHEFPIIPLRDKIPIIEYEHRRNQLASTSETDLWFSNGDGRIPKANGIAIAINNTEFGIDIDGHKFESTFLNKIIPNLSTELQAKIDKTMHTKTPHGHHRMFKVLPEDFPDGIKERTIVKFEGHNEIAVKGNDHILFERGPGYEIVNDVDCIVTLSKEETIHLLEALDRFKAQANAVKTIVGILIPHYTNGIRDSLVFALSGYLHKTGIPESFIFEIVESLVSQSNDEESQARLRVVKDTCSKDANSDQVSGYHRLLEALDNNQSTVADIEQVLNELGLGTFNGISRKRDIQNGEVENDHIGQGHKRSKKNEHFAYKYSNKGKDQLHEAVIIGGRPLFLKYQDNMVCEVASKEEASERIIKPPKQEEYPYVPYEFKNMEEVRLYEERAKKESIYSVYQKAKSIVKKYNDQDNYKLNLLAIDIVWSYFQDKFGTTHYLTIVGDNDSGKSSLGNTFEAVGYRVVNMTSPTAPNVFRTLGVIEPGQCTFVLDESDKIDESTDMMNILKSGYDYDKKVSKTNTNSWKVEWFYAYGLKIIIAEKSPNKLKAKGLLDRTLIFHTFPGDTNFDIKEVKNPNGDPELEEALSELLDFRKLMLVYRLIHFKDPIPDIDVGVKRRNKELCKPYIRLFYGSQAQSEVEETFQTFLETKASRKVKSFEAILLPVIIDLVQQKGNSMFTSDIWDFIKARLNGQSNPNNINEYYIGEHTIYKNTITKILEDKFGAGYQHTEHGGKILFFPDKLQKIMKSYDLDIKIKTRLKKTDSTDNTDGYREKDANSEGNIFHKSVEISQTYAKNKVNILPSQRSEDVPVSPSLPQEPSELSEPSDDSIAHNPRE